MEQKTYNPQLIANARSLRSEMSPAERRLWFDGLKTLDIRCRRQRPVGRYIVDFYCAKAKLVVEIDGNTHDSDAAQKYDAERTMYLQSLGMMVAGVGTWCERSCTSASKGAACGGSAP